MDKKPEKDLYTQWQDQHKKKADPKQDKTESAVPAVTASNGTVAVDSIVVGESVRSRIDRNKQAFQNLQESLRITGVANPVLVERCGDKFNLISGARRLTACRRLGIKDIPARILQPSGAEDGLAKQLVSDFAREDLHPLDAAKLFFKYFQAKHKTITVNEAISLFNDRKLDNLPAGRAATVAGLINLTDLSQSTIRNQLRLLKLPEPVQCLIRNGNVSASCGYILAEHPDREDLNELAEKVAQKQMTRSELKEIFRKDDGSENVSRKRYSRIIKNFRSSLEKDVNRMGRDDRSSLVKELKDLMDYLADRPADVIPDDDKISE